MVNHNVFNKIAVINDLTGFGRCALSVEMPIISHMGIQCCPVPTSVLSNHSAYESFYMRDLTKDITPFMTEWKKLGLHFDAVLTGFCGSAEQIDAVTKIVDDFSNEENIVIVDPIMGDNGECYSVYNNEMCNKMKALIVKANIITPNLTELCILAEEEYDESYSNEKIGYMCEKLAKNMKKESGIVVTGLKRGMYIANYIYEQGDYSIIRKKTAGENRCGTGDVFAAVLAGSIVQGKTLSDSVKKAADFVSECIKESDKINVPRTDGVCFEKILYKL